MPHRYADGFMYPLAGYRLDTVGAGSPKGICQHPRLKHGVTIGAVVPVCVASKAQPSGQLVVSGEVQPSRLPMPCPRVIGAHLSRFRGLT